MEVLTIGDIFNNVMCFINIIGDSKSIMLTNKTIYKLVKENDLFKCYMQLLRSPKIDLYNVPNGTPQYYFIKACLYGNFLCKNITENNKINIRAEDDFAFRWSCQNGHLEVAKWLIKLSQSEGFNLIDIHVGSEYAFQWSCQNGHLEVAKWLIELSQSEGFSLIDIHAKSEYAFQLSCFKGHIEVAKWLIELSQSEGFTPIPKEIISEYLKN